MAGRRRDRWVEIAPSDTPENSEDETLDGETDDTLTEEQDSETDDTESAESNANDG